MFFFDFKVCRPWFSSMFFEILKHNEADKLDQKNRLTVAGDFNLTLTQITFKTFSGGCRWIPISLDKQVTLWPPFDFSKFFWQSFSCQGGSFLPCRCSTQMPLLMEGANRLFTKSFVICLITNLGTQVRKPHFRKIPIIKVFLFNFTIIIRTVKFNFYQSTTFYQTGPRVASRCGFQRRNLHSSDDSWSCLCKPTLPLPMPQTVAMLWCNVMNILYN